MANTELDPLFLKGLRLLHSKSKDSTDQLKQLLDDAIAQSKQTAVSKDKGFTSIKLESDSKLHIKKVPIRDASEVSSTISKLEEVRKRDPEKRSFDKIHSKQDDFEIIHEAKLPKLESPQVFAFYPPSPDLPKLEQFVPKRADDDTDTSDDNADADDFAMEMGLACVICKQIEVSHGNQLIECQECHSLYHQECHRPPATDYDVNDPRRVWYCAKCTKNMKKLASKNQKTSKSSNSAMSKEPASQTRSGKPENTQATTLLPFKRTELKAPVSQGINQSSTNKPIGLAGLAANLSGRVTTTASSVSSTSARPATSKANPSNSSLKSFSTFSSHIASSSTKTSVQPPSSSAKIANSSSFSTSSSSVPPIVIAKNSVSSSTAPKTGLGLLSSVIAANSCTSRTASSGNNGGTKPASCSLLMSADKRVQIMKKKAAKLQEKRRLSTK